MTKPGRTAVLLSAIFCRALCLARSDGQSPPATFYSQRLDRVAFGSCSKQWLPQPLWDPIIAFKPQLWLWTGDAIYGKTAGETGLSDGFAMQLQQPGYRTLMSQAIVEGTWDDHDYGQNDAGKDLPQRDEAQELFLDFIGVRARSPRRQERKGVYSAHTFGSPPEQAKVILLDTRSFRDPHYIPSVGGSSLPFGAVFAALGRGACAHCSFGADYEGDMLGEAQWKWLRSELSDSKAAVHIIVSSVQVLTSNPFVESWGHFPQVRAATALPSCACRPPSTSPSLISARTWMDVCRPVHVCSSCCATSARLVWSSSPAMCITPRWLASRRMSPPAIRRSWQHPRAVRWWRRTGKRPWPLLARRGS